MATTQTGTYDISSLLAARFQSVADFGLDTIERILLADIATHNQIVTEMVSDLADLTTDRQRIYGSTVAGEMVEVDEYGRSPTQRALPGSTVAFPLKLFQFAVGWTRKWMETKSPADMAQLVLAGQRAHWRAIVREMKKALYVSANYTYTDHLVDNVALAVKRLANADSAAVPDGPNGETFDGATHTHYDGEASLTAAFLTALINNVVEHGYGGAVKVAIARADEAAVRALTGFTAYVDPRVVFRNTDTPGQTVDITRLDNRAIGIFGAAEIWVKPWAIATYLFAWDSGSPNKPLAFRQRSATSLQGLHVAGEIDAYPLHARYMEAEYGFGVWTRTNGAVLFTTNATYADPVI